MLAFGRKYRYKDRDADSRFGPGEFIGMMGGSIGLFHDDGVTRWTGCDDIEPAEEAESTARQIQTFTYRYRVQSGSMLVEKENTLHGAGRTVAELTAECEAAIGVKSVTEASSIDK